MCPFHAHCPWAVAYLYRCLSSIVITINSFDSNNKQDYRVSELTISGANKEHSGNYSCVPSRAEPAFVVVHVFKGRFNCVEVFWYYYYWALSLSAHTTALYTGINKSYTSPWQCSFVQQPPRHRQGIFSSSLFFSFSLTLCIHRRQSGRNVSRSTKRCRIPSYGISTEWISIAHHHANGIDSRIWRGRTQ